MKFLKKFFNPGFYVCYWETGNQMQSGSFAALGNTYDEAAEDAVKYLTGIKMDPTVINFKIKRPSIKERFNAVMNQ